MTTYTLFVKSDILNIKCRALNTFLRLLGYDANIFDNIKFVGSNPTTIEEYNIIEFKNLNEAQKAECELRKMFYCYIIAEIEYDQTYTKKVRIVNLTSFKGEHGKYYDNFDIQIPAETKDFDLVEAILKASPQLPEYFIYHGYYANNVPFIIPAHMKASDIKPYVKLGENK